MLARGGEHAKTCPEGEVDVDTNKVMHIDAHANAHTKDDPVGIILQIVHITR